jgi:TolB protein
MPPIRNVLLLLAALAAISAPLPLQAQGRDSIPGVALGLLYETGTNQQPIVIKPFQGRLGGEALAGQVEAIVARDLRYSDRYRVMDSIPGAFLNQEGIDYALWDRLGATWLLSGIVEGGGDGYVVTLELHDIVYKQLKQRGTFRLPAANAADFRMAVHRTSDEVVQWTFGEPGMAASRIAFTMLQNGVKELYVVDSDGENQQRLTNVSDVVLSPAWSPDGRRIAYSSVSDIGNWQISELDLSTRRTRRVQSEPNVDYITPAYHPDGETLAYSVITKTGSNQFIDVATYNIARECCQKALTQRSRDNLSPTFSPDGRYVAFNSNRLGDAVPQIFVMPSEGGSPELISPYGFDRQGYYTSPDWSPFGNLVAFHGRVTRSGNFHILVARMGERARLTQLTWEGQNEDPSWAPDGRHLVFRGERSWGKGLFVVDTVTGNIRPILSGVDVTTPQWSPPMREAAPTNRPD